MQTSVIHLYQILTFVEDVWTMWRSQSMVFCRLAFISSHESNKKKGNILVRAVQRYRSSHS